MRTSPHQMFAVNQEWCVDSGMQGPNKVGNDLEMFFQRLEGLQTKVETRTQIAALEAKEVEQSTKGSVRQDQSGGLPMKWVVSKTKLVVHKRSIGKLQGFGIRRQEGQD